MFSYFFLTMAEMLGLRVDLDIYEPRRFGYCGPAGCNHCGGVVSESLVQRLATEGICLPDEIVQRGTDSYQLHMDIGDVGIETPLMEKRIAAVYRGNGILLPWGNMTMVLDPCQHWAVFKMLNTKSTKPSAQISVLRSDDEKYLYCCQSIRSRDAAGNAHVMCAGIDLAPALTAQGFNAAETIDMIEASCNRGNGIAGIPTEARKQLESIGKILNIGWIEDGAAKEASIICPRSSACPRDKHCLGKAAKQRLRPQIDRIRESVIASADS